MTSPSPTRFTALIPSLLISSLLLTTATAQEAPPAGTSALWGKAGELWSPAGRLPDFSFAGYHSGEAPLPSPPVVLNVRDVGAKGDGETDDTDAFKRAIETAQNGAILVPAGRYKISDILYIRKSNVVLRGEGSDKSILFFTKSLEDVKPHASATTDDQKVTEYSWSGGLVWVEGKQEGKQLARVAAKAARGTNVLELSAPAALKPGDRIEIVQTDPGDKSFINHLYNGDAGDTKNIGWARTPFVSKVTAVDGTKVTLERTLRTDVDPAWKPTVNLFQPSVREVGIENLGFEFPSTPYMGHFTEVGFNPLALDRVADCWVRNVRILNADSGPFLSGNFTTIQNIVLESVRTPDAKGHTGHHGVTMGTDNLLTDFDIRTKFIHDVSVEGTAGSVIAHGRGVDISFDHHKRHPHANLFTDIDLGLGTRMFYSGGGGALGRNSGAWETFWNIRAARPQAWPWKGWGPDTMNLVGVQTVAPAQLDAAGRWFEPIPPAQLQPQNLYEAQLARRQSKSFPTAQ